MSTWRTVLGLEWRILKRDRSALAVLGIFALFLLLGAGAGGRTADSLAEGIERPEEAQVCAEIVCQLGQGYFWGRPERVK